MMIILGSIHGLVLKTSFYSPSPSQVLRLCRQADSLGGEDSHNRVVSDVFVRNDAEEGRKLVDCDDPGKVGL